MVNRKMKDQMYRDICEPSPLSKPPKRETKLLTFEEFEAMVKRSAIQRAYEQVKIVDGADYPEAARFEQ